MCTAFRLTGIIRQINEWPERVREAAEVSHKPVWVTEVGVSSFGAQGAAFRIGADPILIKGRVERIHWYSLFDLPPTWPAETRHKEAEGSSYYDTTISDCWSTKGSSKLAAASFPSDGTVGLCQWFHFDDHRLEDAADWMKAHGVTYLRTGLSWAETYRPSAAEWFDRQMQVLAPFQVALTLCFTPAHLGIEAHHTSPPKDPLQFAEFASWAVSRYAPASSSSDPAPKEFALR